MEIIAMDSIWFNMIKDNVENKRMEYNYVF
jgi:hypothetical protein